MTASSTPSPTGLSRRSWTWFVVAAIGLLVVSAMILWVAPSPQAGSTYSRSLTGYRNWYDYMLQQQRPVKRWQRSYDQLSGSGQTLIRVGNQQTRKPNLGLDAFNAENQQPLRTWLENGNTVIQLYWQGKVTGAPFASQLQSEQNQVLIETTRRHSTLEVARQYAGSKQTAAELRDSFGVVAWSESVGDGTLISCVYPWLAANALIDQKDNYQFLATLAQQQPGPIWVDEWMHGHRDPVVDTGAKKNDSPEDFFEYLARTPVAVMTAQAGFILLLLIWSNNNRFGALETLKPEQKDASEQYIQALASTLNAARKTEFVTQTLGDYFQKTLATELGLMALYGDNRPQTAQISAQWSQTTGRSAEKITALLEPTIKSDRDLIVWVANIESLLRELS